jgi:hypothetical protein
VDLSLYKDEAQLDKLPRKRKHEVKSENDDTDEDYEEESPRKKKPVKSPSSTAKKSPRKIIVKTHDSSESDEENLMEIKKKVKKQVKSPPLLVVTVTYGIKYQQTSASPPSKTSKPTTSKYSDLKPSTSKAVATPNPGSRKRVARNPEPVVVEAEEKPVVKAETVSEVQVKPANSKAKATVVKSPTVKKSGEKSEFLNFVSIVNNS